MKNRFKIGDWVVITAKVVANYIDYDENDNPLVYENTFTKKVKYTKRVIEREQIKPAVGKVVGMAARMNGKYHRERHNYDPLRGSDYESGYLSFTKVIYVWLVRTGMLNKAIEVLDADISLWKGEVKTFPLKYMSPWSDDLRKAVSENSKTWPRDEKGRWK